MSETTYGVLKQMMTESTIQGLSKQDKKKLAYALLEEVGEKPNKMKEGDDDLKGLIMSTMKKLDSVASQLNSSLSSTQRALKEISNIAKGPMTDVADNLTGTLAGEIGDGAKMLKDTSATVLQSVDNLPSVLREIHNMLQEAHKSL
jgi:hypothetical protein